MNSKRPDIEPRPPLMAIATPPFPEVVDHIKEHILAPAEAGELIGISYAVYHRGDRCAGGWTFADYLKLDEVPYAFLGANELNHARLVRRILNAVDPLD